MTKPSPWMGGKMPQQVKHTLTFTEEELIALRDRLVPISPSEYDLHTYSLLRGLYGRIDHVLLKGK